MLENKYADKVLERILQSNKKWGSKDRAFIAENTYELVRWWRLVKEISGIEHITAPHHLYTLAGLLLRMHGYTLPSWPEFNTASLIPIDLILDSVMPVRKIRESIPDWLDDVGEAELGTKWEEEIKALNQQAEVVIRTNTLKTSLTSLQALLEKEKIYTSHIEGYPNALKLNQRKNIFTSIAFKNGLFELQDASSQRVVPCLQLEPGMRLIDACAGSGGKTLHAACIMQNKGKIIALDTEEWKLNNLKLRAARAGVSIIETRVIESSKTIKRLHQSADRLLLDVPCSGLGVLKRNPDAKWKLSPSFLQKVKITQQEILSSYHHMLKPGGILVYATCSILPSENIKQIETFLSKHKNNFELLSETTIFPSKSGYDGFFIASLKKIN
jgi:16S rRNA (cytosine967-C5)-methyltransferase